MRHRRRGANLKDIDIFWCKSCNQLQKFFKHEGVSQCGICGHHDYDYMKTMELADLPKKRQEKIEYERTHLVTAWGPESKQVCSHCKEAGIEHILEDIPDGHTDGMSKFVAGVPKHKRVCSGCQRWDGPWVPAAYRWYD